MMEIVLACFSVVEGQLKASFVAGERLTKNPKNGAKSNENQVRCIFDTLFWVSDVKCWINAEKGVKKKLCPTQAQLFYPMIGR